MVALGKKIGELSAKPFPQTFFVQKPILGAVAFFLMLVGFVVLYRPLAVHQTAFFNFSLTVLVYCALVSPFELAAALAIPRLKVFSKRNRWTVGDELLAIFVLLVSVGMSTYLVGFVMEPNSTRWNLVTFLDSFYRAVLIGLVPVVFPSLLNIRHAFAPQTFQTYQTRGESLPGEVPEERIHISSKAKKERLSFYPGEFVYAESKGNYVNFHLIRQGKPVEASIRNSISEIENQLAGIPDFKRVHRAFIVNLRKVTSRDGNALGYRLTLSGSEDTVPVSRQNAREFEQLMG